MTPTTPPTRGRRSRAAAVALGLTLVGAACSSGDAGVAAVDAEPTGADGGPTTTLVAGNDDLLSAPTTATPPTVDGPADPADDVAAPDDAPLPPNEYGAPYPGSYQYEVDDEGTLARLDVYDTSEERRRELVQLHHFVMERQADAQLVAWEADGLLLLAEQSKRADGSETAKCEWRPQPLLVPRSATVGQSWTIDSSCPAGDDLTRRRTGTSRVVGTEQVELAGATYEVVVIERTYDTTVRSSDGVLDVGQRHELTERWAPGLGLVLRSEGTVSSVVQGVPKDPVPYFRRLLDPRPGSPA